MDKQAFLDQLQEQAGPWLEAIKKKIQENPEIAGSLIGALLGGGLTKMTMGPRATMLDMLLGAALGGIPGYMIGGTDFSGLPEDSAEAAAEKIRKEKLEKAKEKTWEEAGQATAEGAKSFAETGRAVGGAAKTIVGGGAEQLQNFYNSVPGWATDLYNLPFKADVEEQGKPIPDSMIERRKKERKSKKRGDIYSVLNKGKSVREELNESAGSPIEKAMFGGLSPGGLSQKAKDTLKSVWTNYGPGAAGRWFENAVEGPLDTSYPGSNTEEFDSLLRRDRSKYRPSKQQSARTQKAVKEILSKVKRKKDIKEFYKERYPTISNTASWKAHQNFLKEKRKYAPRGNAPDVWSLIQEQIHPVR